MIDDDRIVGKIRLISESRKRLLPRTGAVFGPPRDIRSRVLVGEAQHFQPILECLAFRLETPETVFVYSGDSGGVPDSMIELARDADILVHMCHFASGMEPTKAYRLASGNHMDIAEIARQANVKTVVLTHFIHLLDLPGVLEQLVSEMKAVFSGNIIVGRDLMELPLKIDLPHRID